MRLCRVPLRHCLLVPQRLRSQPSAVHRQEQQRQPAHLREGGGQSKVQVQPEEHGVFYADRRQRDRRGHWDLLVRSYRQEEKRGVEIRGSSAARRSVCWNLKTRLDPRKQSKRFKGLNSWNSTPLLFFFVCFWYIMLEYIWVIRNPPQSFEKIQ